MSAGTRRRGADAVAAALAAAGVRRIFALSGNQIMALFDACIDHDIELVHVRHEAAAVHMADATGRLTGRPGVALVTAGPGHANAVSALYTAACSESPMVLLSGHAPAGGAGRGAFQEIDQAAMAAPVAKAAWTPREPAALVPAVEAAMRLAADASPGPVQVSMPVDLLEGDAVAGEPAAAPPAPPPLDAAALERAADAIAGAERPLLLAGPGGAQGACRAALAELAAATGIPLVTTESPRGLRDPALGAVAGLLSSVDLAVLAGKRLDYTLGFGAAPVFDAGCRFVDVQPDAAVAARHRAVAGETRLAAHVAAAPAAAAPALLEMLATRRLGVAPGWAAQVDEAVRFRPAGWDAIADTGNGRLHPVALFRAVGAVMSGHDAWTLVADGGEIGQWAQALLHAPTRLINGPSGSIGSALPMAIAARMARPDEPVLAVMGDGTFGFHPSEFDTAARHGVAITAIVGNDARWNAEHQLQVREYGADRLVACQLAPTRYDRVVAPFGVEGHHADSADGVEAALRAALSCGGPACIDVALDGQAAPVVARA